MKKGCSCCKNIIFSITLSLFFSISSVFLSSEPENDTIHAEKGITRKSQFIKKWLGIVIEFLYPTEYIEISGSLSRRDEYFADTLEACRSVRDLREFFFVW